MYSFTKGSLTYTLNKAIAGKMFEIKENNELNIVKTPLFDLNLALASSDFDGQYLTSKKEGKSIQLYSKLTDVSLTVPIEEVRRVRNLLLSLYDGKVERTKTVHDMYKDVYKVYQDDKTLTLDRDSVSNIVNHLQGYVDSVSGFSVRATDNFVYLEEESTKLLFVVTFNFLLLIRSFYDMDNFDDGVQPEPIIQVP